MNRIKGFIANPLYVTPTSGGVSPIGELSTYSSTFAKETEVFAAAAYAGVELHTFKMYDDVTQLAIAMPATLDAKILHVASEVYTRYENSLIPSNSPANIAAFVNATPGSGGLGDVFSGDGLTAFSVNALVEVAPTKNMPDYVDFIYNDGTTDFNVRVWFMDDAFRAQYDEFLIEVIPPIDNIDQFDNNTVTVSALLAAMNTAAIVNRIQTLTGDAPATLVKSVNYTWVDPTLSTSAKSTTWVVLVYGPAGNDNDRIKQAIRDYIAAEGNALIDWPALFPDIYAENEFALIPFWVFLTAAPETEFNYGVYEPIWKPSAIHAKLKNGVPAAYGLSVDLDVFVDVNGEVTGAPYRSIAFGILGNPNNAGGIFQMTQKHPSYMNVPTSSPDFARMAVATQNFALKFNEALEIARTMTAASVVPAGFGRATRAGKVYTTFNVVSDQSTYLILTKSSYIALAL
jgi:hypothetical protein